MSPARIAAALAVTAALSVPSDASAARAVSLADASAAPSYLRLLAPGEAVTRSRQCGRAYWSDVNAYRWHGGTLAPQRWNRDRTLTRWGRVTFDGLTFRNGSRSAVLVAGWCER